METGQQGGHFAASRFVSYYNNAWLPSFSLLDDHIDGRSNAECDHFKLVGRLSDDVQRLSANRARGPSNCNAYSNHRVSLSVGHAHWYARA